MKILSKASGLVSFSFFLLVVIQGYRIIHLFDVKKQDDEPDKEIKGKLFKLLAESALLFIIAIGFLSINEILIKLESFSKGSVLDSLLISIQTGCMILGLLSIYGYLKEPGESILPELKKKEKKEKLQAVLCFMKEKFLLTIICFLFSFMLSFFSF